MENWTETEHISVRERNILYVYVQIRQLTVKLEPTENRKVFKNPFSRIVKVQPNTFAESLIELWDRNRGRL